MNVNLNARHSVFANLGYYSRQPFQDEIFLNYRNDLTPLTKNQNTTGMEVGYRYKNPYFKADLNLYNTIWANRNITKGSRDQKVQLADGSIQTLDVIINRSGIKETHRGVELDFRALSPVFTQPQRLLLLWRLEIR